MKSIPLLCLLTLWLGGCTDPDFNEKPSEQTCIKWLTGQKLVLGKGLLLDTVWVIEAGEFRSFAFKEIENAPDHRKRGLIRFELQSGAKQLVVEGYLVYRLHPDDALVEFVSFTPIWLHKKGAW